MDGTGWNQLQTVLADLDFPATSHQILSHARRRGCSAEALTLLGTLPVITYGSRSELHNAIPDAPPDGAEPDS